MVTAPEQVAPERTLTLAPRARSAPVNERQMPDADEIPAICRTLGFDEATTQTLVTIARRRAGRLAPELAGEIPHLASGEAQIEEAFWHLYSDKSRYPRFPWASADRIIGPLAPGMLVITGARTGGGKTTLLLNLLDAWTEAGLTVQYLGLEQAPLELRTKWACVRLGLPPEAALAGDPDRLPYGTSLADAKSYVGAELLRQRQGMLVRRARFSPVKFVGRKELTEVTELAAAAGASIVIVDHVDRLNHGDGRNAFAEMSATIRLAKELAVKHQLVMILASQAKREADKLQKYQPMDLEDLRGGGTKEEESDKVITTYRPMRKGVTAKDLTAVRRGFVEPTEILERHTMAVKNLKDRLNDAHWGRVAKLHIWYGRITEPERREEAIYRGGE